jgi:hypothetical protein
MAANAGMPVARLSGPSRTGEHVGNIPPGTRLLDPYPVGDVDVAGTGRIPGGLKPSAALWVDPQRSARFASAPASTRESSPPDFRGARSARLVCPANDPHRESALPGWLPPEHIADCHAWRPEVRWPAGATTAFATTARHGRIRVFDGEGRSTEAALGLAHRAPRVHFEIRGWSAPSKMVTGEGIDRDRACYRSVSSALRQARADSTDAKAGAGGTRQRQRRSQSTPLRPVNAGAEVLRFLWRKGGTSLPRIALPALRRRSSVPAPEGDFAHHSVVNCRHGGLPRGKPLSSDKTP